MVESVVIPRVIEFILNDFNHYLSQLCRCFRTGKGMDRLKPTTSSNNLKQQEKKKGASTAKATCFLLARTTEVCAFQETLRSTCLRNGNAERGNAS